MRAAPPRKPTRGFSFFGDVVCFHRMTPEELQRAKNVIKHYPAIKLAYLFGSRATGKTGPRSDHDFAVYLDEKDPRTLADIQFALQSDLCRALGSDRVDVVVLNTAQSPELKYAVVRDGQLLHEEEPFKIIVEPRILNEYFEFRDLLTRFGLTRA